MPLGLLAIVAVIACAMTAAGESPLLRDVAPCEPLQFPDLQPSSPSLPALAFVFGQPNKALKAEPLRPVRRRHVGVRFDTNAADAGLRWLSYFQEEDGSWDVLRWEGCRHFKQDSAALGLLAFLSSGHTEKVGEYKPAVRKAVAWLKARQKPDGRIGGAGGWPADPVEHYRLLCEHALATLALSEAAGMANIPETREAAQKALDVLFAQNLFGALIPKLEKDARIEAYECEGLAWIVLAWKSGKVAGLNVSHDWAEQAAAYLESCRTGDELRLFGRERNVLDTLVLAVCLQHLGFEREATRPALEWVLTQKDVLPPYERASERTDPGILYFGSLAFVHQCAKLWKAWDPLRKASIVDTASLAFETQGSWAPAGAWQPRGRVPVTAIFSLCGNIWLRWPAPDEAE